MPAGRRQEELTTLPRRRPLITRGAVDRRRADPDTSSGTPRPRGPPRPSRPRGRATTWRRPPVRAGMPPCTVAAGRGPRARARCDRGAARLRRHPVRHPQRVDGGHASAPRRPHPRQRLTPPEELRRGDVVVFDASAAFNARHARGRPAPERARRRAQPRRRGAAHRLRQARGGVCPATGCAAARRTAASTVNGVAVTSPTSPRGTSAERHDVRRHAAAGTLLGDGRPPRPLGRLARPPRRPGWRHGARWTTSSAGFGCDTGRSIGSGRSTEGPQRSSVPRNGE